MENENKKIEIGYFSVGGFLTPFKIYKELARVERLITGENLDTKEVEAFLISEITPLYAGESKIAIEVKKNGDQLEIIYHTPPLKQFEALVQFINNLSISELEFIYHEIIDSVNLELFKLLPFPSEFVSVYQKLKTLCKSLGGIYPSHYTDIFVLRQQLLKSAVASSKAGAVLVKIGCIEGYIESPEYSIADTIIAQAFSND